MLEVLGVLLIFSTVSMMIFPNMISALSSYRLEASAKRLAKDISTAKMHAIMFKESVWIDFYLTSEGVFYEIKSGTLLESGDEIVSPVLKGLKSFPKEIKITNLPHGNRLSFNRKGYPSQGVTINLTNSRGKRLYVIVAARSGRVRVSNYGSIT
ncbi:hypothetical protein ACONDI_01549 [Natranaerofaba carboxydovora]|nr:hypothetical protein ACONDI_01549 [Natranaerofaba carboxydovora]